MDFEYLQCNAQKFADNRLFKCIYKKSIDMHGDELIAFIQFWFQR